MLGPREIPPCSRGFISIVNTDTRQVDGDDRALGEFRPLVRRQRPDGQCGWPPTLCRYPRRLWRHRRRRSGSSIPRHVSGSSTIDLGFGYDARCAWAADARHLICSQNGRPPRQSLGHRHGNECRTNLRELLLSRPTSPRHLMAASSTFSTGNRCRAGRLDLSAGRDVAVAARRRADRDHAGRIARLRQPTQFARRDRYRRATWWLPRFHSRLPGPVDIAFARGRAYVLNFH